MNRNIKEKSYELGRRLVKGPRRHATTQAAGDKCLVLTGKPNKPLPGKWRRKNTKIESPPESLNILQLNICGLSKKRTELAKIMNSFKVHIALLQETLHSNVNTHISGYTSYACSCKSCRGLVTYVRNDITAECSNHGKEDKTDIQKSIVWYKENKYVIYNVYSPPTTTCEIDDLQDSVYRKTIIAGDFNGHSPQWGYTNTNSTGKYLEELNETTNLTILQDTASTPTLLHRAHNTLSRPDLTIVSADLSLHCDAQVLTGIGSDHRPILTKVAIPRNTTEAPQARPRWNFKKANWSSYTNCLETAFSSMQKDQINIHDLEEKFTATVLDAAKQHIPRGTPPKYRPFWTQEIQEAVSQRRQAREKLEKNPTPENKTDYNRTSAVAKRIIANAKQEKWKETCSSLDLRKEGTKAWSLLNRLSGKKQRTNPRPMPDGETPKKRSEKFNKFFASINKSRNDKDTDHDLLKELKNRERNSTTPTTLFDDPFTTKELNHAIKKLKMRKSPGPDLIHNEMIHHLGPCGRQVLLKLINLSWEKECLPKVWKNAHIIPILKKDKDPKLEKSYRPISLTSCVGKTAERMINRRLYWWLEDSGLLTDVQSGFRAGCRTEDQLFRLCQSIQDGFQQGTHTVAVFVDLQQAYDRVWRKGLLLKMKRLGIGGRMFKWIKNFLNERTIQTKIEDRLSSKQTLEEGLPQGSVLSCTLFLIYINDLPNILKASKALYADDLVIWTSHRYARQSARHLNRDLESLNSYCKKWKLTINPTKTVYSIFTLSPKVSQQNLQIKIDGKEAASDKQPVYLGVQLDTRLTLCKHIQNLREKATKRLALIKRLASTNWGSNMSTLRAMYLGYVRSILDYNNSLQISCSKSNQSVLDRIQNNALRFICGGMRSTPSSACEIQTNIEPLGMRRERAALELHERFHRMAPNHPAKKLVTTWKPKTRIKHQSLLHNVKEIAKKHYLPEERAPTSRVSPIPPNAQTLFPEVLFQLKDKSASKKTDLLQLKMIAEDTILEYPDDWIHIYTDGSAFKATINAGFGAWIRFPTGTSHEISGACGSNCSNYEAELMAINSVLRYLDSTLQDNPQLPTGIVIFSDSKSALQAIENDVTDSEEVQRTISAANNLLLKYHVRLVLQWIPGHTDIAGNDRADRLAKQGAHSEQPHRPVTIQTVRQILRQNYKEEWMNLWASGSTGRAVYKHMNMVKPKDSIRSIERKHQTTIFRLRTQHVPLNFHLNRINPEHPPLCLLCGHPYETTQHLLFDCAKLQDLRKLLLPPKPDTDNTLYSTPEQLRKTSTYYTMALSRRAKAQLLLD